MSNARNILDVLSEPAAQVLAASEKAQNEIVSNAQKAAEISNSAAAVLSQVSSDAALIARQKGLADLQKQQIVRKALINAGTDPTTGQGTVLNLVSELHARGQETQQLLRKKEEEAAGRSIFNPVDWFKAATDWTGTERKLTAAVTGLKTADTLLSSITGAIENVDKISEKTKETLTASTIEASANIISSEAKLKAYQSQIEGLKYNSAAVKAIAEGSNDRLKVLYDLATATRMEEQYDLEVKRYRLSLEHFDWQKEEKKVADTARQLNRSIDEMSLFFVNQSRASMGLKEMTAEEYGVQKALDKPELKWHLNKGQQIAATGRVGVGDTPAETAEVLKVIPSNLPQIRADVVDLIRRAEEELGIMAEKNPNLYGDNKENASRRAAKINKITNDEIVRQFGRITPEESNLFHVGDLASYIGTPDRVGIGTLHRLPISQKLLIPMISAGQKLNDPKYVLGAGIEAVKKGTLTSEELIGGISTIYQRANIIHQEARTFRGFGIRVPLAGKQYNAVVGRTVVNLTDPVAVGSYVNRVMFRDNYKDFKGHTPYQSPEELEAQYLFGR